MPPRRAAYVSGTYSEIEDAAGSTDSEELAEDGLDFETPQAGGGGSAGLDEGTEAEEENIPLQRAAAQRSEKQHPSEAAGGAAEGSAHRGAADADGAW